MKRMLVLGFLTFSTLFGAAGCSDDSSPGGSTPTPKTPTSDFKLSCSAELLQGRHFDYSVNGSALTLTTMGQSLTLSRANAAAGDRPVYGQWQVPDVPLTGDPAFIAQHQMKISAVMQIDAERLTITASCSSREATLTATASSKATVTDSAIDVLETHREEKQWTTSGGAQTISKLSVDPFATPEAAEAQPEHGVLGISF